jgi:aspartyl-tRNA(Asn)/glutamyl-tRNA(Gln) amidotransferase subunit A
MTEQWNALIKLATQTWHLEDLGSEQLKRMGISYEKWNEQIKPHASSLAFNATPSDYLPTLVKHAGASFDSSGFFHYGPSPRLGELPANPLEASMNLIAGALERKEISSLELTTIALARLAEIQPATNACVAMTSEQALAQAKEKDQLFGTSNNRGRLHGVPLAHKDLLYKAGVNAGCGIKPREPRPYAFEGSAPVVTQLHQQGSIDTARLHMTEFAFDPSGLNTEYGPCHNPWALDRVPGGSSSGSAVTVASRATFGAIGSDTGGSIRIPASLCGLTGLKPTWGLVDTTGAMPLSHTNDHLGPLTRSAADCALMMRVLMNEKAVSAELCQQLAKGFDAVASGAFTNLKGLRIGIPEQFFFDGIDPAIDSIFKQSLDLYTTHGATIVPLPTFYWDRINALGAVTTRVEAATRIPKISTIFGLSSIVIERFQEGLALPGTLYVQALNERAIHLDYFINVVMKEVDVIVTPVCKVQTPLISQLEHGSAEALHYRYELTILNRAFNYLGLPALSLPGGFMRDSKGRDLPVGLQLIGKPYADAKLLGVGAAWQKMTDHHLRMPSLS